MKIMNTRKKLKKVQQIIKQTFAHDLLMKCILHLKLKTTYGRFIKQ